jgi:uncharacterized protein YndB with AHSA1/START domain
MLKKATILAVFLAAAFAVMMLANREKEFSVGNSCLVDQPAGDLWQVLTAVELWPRWWPGMQKSSLSPSLRKGATLELVLRGNPQTTPARIESVVPERELAWSRGGVLGSLSRTTLSLKPVPGGTQVAIESRIHGPQAFLAGFTGREEFSRYHERVLAGLEAATEKERGNP